MISSRHRAPTGWVNPVRQDGTRVRSALRAVLNSHPSIKVVAEADRAAEALALAREFSGIVLVDVHLPTKDDGLHLLYALTGEPGIQVVAISIDASAWQSALVVLEGGGRVR